MNSKRKYEFSWELIGDIENGRPNLGNTTRVEIYRLMQFTFRDIIELYLGADETDNVFYKAGKLAGKEFYKHMMQPSQNLNEFISQLKVVLQELGMGILRIEHTDIENGELILTVSEDIDCSGLPEREHEICTYDEGFLAALLESYTGTEFHVKEVDCWCTGDRTCRFQAKAIKSTNSKESL